MSRLVRKETPKQCLCSLIPLAMLVGVLGIFDLGIGDHLFEYHQFHANCVVSGLFAQVKGLDLTGSQGL